MKSAVTLSLVPELRGGPWIYWDDLSRCFSQAKSLGFDGVELFTATAEAPDGLETVLAETGLSLAAVGTGAGKVMHGWTLIDPEASVREQAKTFIKQMIDTGAQFGAPAIIGSMQGVIARDADREQALAWLAEGVIECGQHAGAQGVDLIYEPLNRYETNLFNQLQPAADWLDEIGAESVMLLGDLFHMNIEEDDMAAALRGAARRLGHVHLADSNRRPGGFGHTDFFPIGTALRESGYDRFVSAEAFCWPNDDEAARATLHCFRTHFQASA